MLTSSQTSPCSGCSPGAAAAALPSAHRRAPASPRRCLGEGASSLGARGLSSCWSSSAELGARAEEQLAAPRLPGTGSASQWPEARLPRGAATTGVPARSSGKPPMAGVGLQRYGLSGAGAACFLSGRQPAPRIPAGKRAGSQGCLSCPQVPAPAIGPRHFPISIVSRRAWRETTVFPRWSLTIWPPARFQLCHTQVELQSEVSA